MNRGQLKTLSRLYVRGAKENRITATTHELILQEATDDIATKLLPLRQSAKFDVEENKWEYDLSNSTETVDRFLAIAESGLWWNQGTEDSPNWKKLDPAEIDWLDINRPTWRNLETGNPMYYAIDGDKLIIVPVPSADLTNGFWLWFGEAPVRMTSDDHYPFGNTTEISSLAILSHTIIKYVEAKFLDAVNKTSESDAVMNDYNADIEKKRKLLGRRLDIAYSVDTKIKGQG